MKENVILIGFMGVGKTSLGKLLASKLGRAFIDLDEKIEQDAGISIPKIFEMHGEKYFRELEKAAVREVTARKRPSSQELSSTAPWSSMVRRYSSFAIKGACTV